MTMKTEGFAITSGRGFHITFPNGVTVSVQFGGGQYCEHYYGEIGSEPAHHKWSSTDAEVAAWDKNGEWITKRWRRGGDNVVGYQSPSDVLALLKWAASRKEKKESE